MLAKTVRTFLGRLPQVLLVKHACQLAPTWKSISRRQVRRSPLAARSTYPATQTEYRLAGSIGNVHPQTSYEILKGIEFPWPIAEIARQHHERVDGSGYPQASRIRRS